MTFEEHLLTFMESREVQKLMNSLNNPQIKGFKLNSLKVNSINDLFPNASFSPLKHQTNAYEFDREELGKDVLFQTGAYYIQEPSAMMAVEFLNIEENDNVLDMCAAPGGKSFQLINKLKDTGLLVSNDISSSRSRVLSSNMEKCGAKNIIVLNEDSKKYKEYFKNFFDKILLDAPCSGSGMFRKNNLSKEDWTINKVLACKNVQLELIEDAYEMLKPGGEMLYSTCSFSIQENEEVIIEFLNKHPDCKIIENPLCSEYNDSIKIHGCLRLYPSKFKGEGHFIAHIKKESNNFTDSRIKVIKESRVDKIVIDFLKSFNLDFDSRDIIKLNDNYYYATFKHLDLSKLKVLRYGLHLGRIENKRFIPNHSLAMYHKVDKSKYLDLTSDEAKDYLKGYTIAKEGNRGLVIVSYKNLPLGFGKQVNNIIKNHLPKGLIIR